MCENEEVSKCAYLTDLRSAIVYEKRLGLWEAWGYGLQNAFGRPLPSPL